MKYPSIIAAMFIGLLSTAALAADPAGSDKGDRMKGGSENQPGQNAGETDHATGTKQNSPREAPDASAQLKKCDSLQGNDKKNCIAAAKKGQM